MKKTLAFVLTAVMSLSLLAGCGSKTTAPDNTNNDQPQQAALSGSVSTNGSTSMEKVIGALSEQFMADNSGVSVTYDPTGSGAGIEAAGNGSADISMEQVERICQRAVWIEKGDLRMDGPVDKVCKAYREQFN